MAIFGILEFPPLLIFELFGEPRTMFDVFVDNNLNFKNFRWLRITRSRACTSTSTTWRRRLRGWWRRRRRRERSWRERRDPSRWSEFTFQLPPPRREWISEFVLLFFSIWSHWSFWFHISKLYLKDKVDGGSGLCCVWNIHWIISCLEKVRHLG